MPAVEVSLPEHVESEIARLVDQGEFLNREQAVEELLSMGVSAYETSGNEGPEIEEDLFTQAVDDQQDPAALSDPDDDEYAF